MKKWSLQAIKPFAFEKKREPKFDYKCNIVDYIKVVFLSSYFS